jgi:hypothetical protein
MTEVKICKGFGQKSANTIQRFYGYFITRPPRVNIPTWSSHVLVDFPCCEIQDCDPTKGDIFMHLLAQFSTTGPILEGFQIMLGGFRIKLICRF